MYYFFITYLDKSILGSVTIYEFPTNITNVLVAYSKVIKENKRMINMFITFKPPSPSFLLLNSMSHKAYFKNILLSFECLKYFTMFYKILI